jgi:hypothetical protein
MLLEYDSPRHGIANDHGILLVGYLTHLTHLNSGSTCMEPHAYLQSLCTGDPSCLWLSSQGPLQAQGGQHSALRMVLLGHWSAKDQQATVASDRAEHASIALCLRVRQLMQRM